MWPYIYRSTFSFRVTNQGAQPRILLDVIIFPACYSRGGIVTAGNKGGSSPPNIIICRAPLYNNILAGVEGARPPITRGFGGIAPNIIRYNIIQKEIDKIPAGVRGQGPL